MLGRHYAQLDEPVARPGIILVPRKEKRRFCNAQYRPLQKGLHDEQLMQLDDQLNRCGVRRLDRRKEIDPVNSKSKNHST